MDQSVYADNCKKELEYLNGDYSTTAGPNAVYPGPKALTKKEAGEAIKKFCDDKQSKEPFEGATANSWLARGGGGSGGGGGNSSGGGGCAIL